eukprot:scaffold36319_cov112-Isochrysis_galbana.AAC.1
MEPVPSAVDRARALLLTVILGIDSAMTKVLTHMWGRRAATRTVARSLRSMLMLARLGCECERGGRGLGAEVMEKE